MYRLHSVVRNFSLANKKIMYPFLTFLRVMKFGTYETVSLKPEIENSISLRNYELTMKPKSNKSTFQNWNCSSTCFNWRIISLKNIYKLERWSYVNSEADSIISNIKMLYMFIHETRSEPNFANHKITIWYRRIIWQRDIVC